MAFRMKLVAGGHRVGPVFGEVEGFKVETVAGKNFSSGDIFDCDVDLSQRWPEKFQRLDTAEAVAVEGGTLEDKDDAEYTAMTYDELKKLATELEIKYPANVSKAVLIEKVKEAYAS